MIKKRNASELLPLIMAMISSVLYFGFSFEIVGVYGIPFISFFLAASGIIQGWSFVSINGRNGVVFLDVVICSLLLIVEMAFFVIAIFWY
jgi:hypothetical protein